ncbi:MAG: metallophosphoesterase, partial [Kiritimatiellae bacterium]|nr:metallophosphoesterase [Kiritimatiellia bacterium]
APGKAKGRAAAAACGRLLASPPVLQNAAETSMGVGFAVSAMANGYVLVSTSPDMSNARKVKCGGFRVTDMNDKIMLVRLTGLEPATTYYYRIGADRIDYRGGYSMRIVGTEEDPRIYSFTTLGASARSHFCVINDTHARMKPFGMAIDKIAELGPSCVVWNGDACNTQETIDSLVPIFYTPAIERSDYAATQPYLFVPGNHDNRGLAARHLERAMMFRQPEERSSRDWDLGRNFAVRCGEIAMIGLDTGEDKLDGRDLFAGLFNMEPYRVAQREWLADALERPDVKSAPYVVAFCHIPLYDSDPRSNPGDVDKDGGGRYRSDFAAWQRTCKGLWGPLLERHGVQVVVTAHKHCYRYDAPNADHSWAHVVGGGPVLGSAATGNAWSFPTVIEGRVEGGRLRIVVHDVFNGRVAGSFSYMPRSVG